MHRDVLSVLGRRGEHRREVRLQLLARQGGAAELCGGQAARQRVWRRHRRALGWRCATLLQPPSSRLVPAQPVIDAVPLDFLSLHPDDNCCIGLARWLAQSALHEAWQRPMSLKEIQRCSSHVGEGACWLKVQNPLL